MNFSGWVPLRRGLLDHLMTGKLTANETLVFLILVLLADASTGSGTINAPALGAFHPELSYQSCKRTLQRLEQKGYIFREIIPRSKAVYRFWIDKFEVTRGPHKAYHTDISKALVSKQVSDIRYVNADLQRQPHTEPQDEPQPKPQGDLYYNKNTKQEHKQRNLSEAIGSKASEEIQSVGIEDRAQRNHIEQGGCNPSLPCASIASIASAASQTGAGLRWSGVDGSFVDMRDGSAIDHATANRKIQSIGLEWRIDDFRDIATGEVLPWKEGLKRIKGEDIAA